MNRDNRKTTTTVEKSPCKVPVVRCRFIGISATLKKGSKGHIANDSYVFRLCFQKATKDNTEQPEMEVIRPMMSNDNLKDCIQASHNRLSPERRSIWYEILVTTQRLSTNT
uniref:Uncharacterized protein n=1 Tax=Spongospora subterranea TaxID=70186 RepID=A0A0H5RDI0_9EUKA|eukprot:CRZ11791.1 hypothetical protein [Spongospora subterranea]